MRNWVSCRASAPASTQFRNLKSLAGIMKLSEALRIETAPRLALVGAGGKTTALFQLAGEIAEAHTGSSSSSVLVTCSTHLGLDQAQFAVHHVVLHEAGEIEAIAESLPSGVILFTGVESGDRRWLGLEPPALAQLSDLAEKFKLPLLIEADGSRMKPLKAPAAHEPVIPPFVDTVVVVAGLSALGQPLAGEWVHRPEIFASLAGISADAQISPEAAARVLTHPQGGLKNIPPDARRLVLLNQADTSALQAIAGSMARDLLTAYQGVIIGALNPPVFSISPQAFPSTLPFMPHPSPVYAVHERIAGLILAAGEARRFGQPKPLLNWRGQPFIKHVIAAAQGAGLSPVIVVSGAYSDQISQACAGMTVELVHNPDWGEGQSASLRAGLRALNTEAGAAVFLLADQPQVSAGLIAGLIEAHAAGLPPVVAPLVDGQRANPTLFDRRTFPDLMALQGDVGGRALFSKYEITWVPWYDPSLLLDVDTMEDYQKLLELDGGE
jgi:molybdenum cofactor cytidylyltransferase